MPRACARRFDLLELADGRVFERYSKSSCRRPHVGRVWSFRDITERRRAEEALRDETRMLELLNETGTALAVEARSAERWCRRSPTRRRS